MPHSVGIHCEGAFTMPSQQLDRARAGGGDRLRESGGGGGDARLRDAERAAGDGCGPSRTRRRPCGYWPCGPASRRGASLAAEQSTRWRPQFSRMCVRRSLLKNASRHNMTTRGESRSACHLPSSRPRPARAFSHDVAASQRAADSSLRPLRRCTGRARFLLT